MTYAAESDLDAKFGATEITQLSDRDNTGVRQEAVIALALNSADALINSKLGDRFMLPIPTPYPQRLIDLACDLARFELYAGEPSAQVVRRYNNALAQLVSVRDGLETLGLDATAQPFTTQDTATIEVQAERTIFHRPRNLGGGDGQDWLW